MAVLLDTSRSMATRDVDGNSRIGAALKTLKKKSIRAALENEFILDTRGFDKKSRAVDLGSLTAGEARGKASDLPSALIGAIRDLDEGSLSGERPQKEKNLAGILLVSDGRSTREGAV